MKDIHSLSHTKWNCKYHVVYEMELQIPCSIRTKV